MNYHETKRN